MKTPVAKSPPIVTPARKQLAQAGDRGEFLTIYTSILNGMFAQYERRSEGSLSGYKEYDDQDERERSTLLVERAIAAARIAADEFSQELEARQFSAEVA